MLIKFIIFLVLNFTALGLGGILMGEGPSSEWYQNLQKAPWTPPGWVFGAAWNKANNRQILLMLFIFQWVLNVSWNPIFFRYHQAFFGLLLILALTGLVGFLLFYCLKPLRFYSLFILPYFIWLLVATSLNAYIYLNN